MTEEMSDAEEAERLFCLDYNTALYQGALLQAKLDEIYLKQNPPALDKNEKLS